ncbi:MAG: DMT family transporter, partial [Synergistaceae bacterium]|nr:DMT family transporter [Synergistaceae bacterium]
MAPRVISPRRAGVEITLCVFSWAASFAFMKAAVSEMPPFLAVWFRILFGLLIIIPAAMYRGDCRKPFRDEVTPFLILAFLGVVFHQNLQFTAMRSAGVASSNWMIAGTPLFVALLSWIFLKEKLNGLAISGLVISGLGVLLIMGLGTRNIGVPVGRGLGDLMIALSAVNWGAFQILSRRLLRDHTPAFSVFWINLFALVMQSALVFFIAPQKFSGLLDVSVRVWCSVIFLGCVCSGLCYLLWYDGLSVLPATSASVFMLLQPIFGAVVA